MKLLKTASSLTVLATMLSLGWGSPVEAEWIPDGMALCTATGNQSDLAIASDDSGGALVVWVDRRTGSDDVYVQRVSASGDTLWTGDGVLLCTTTGDQQLPAVVSDGAGGAIVTWHDHLDIFAQRVDASGDTLWTEDGIALCDTIYSQSDPKIVSDGSGGAIVAWADMRASNQDIYAQRVDASGTVQWIANGVALCTAATGSRWGLAIASDGAGGAIVTWNEDRGSTGHDVYAQRVDASGTVQWTADGVALCTATGDQIYPRLTSDGAGGAIVAWDDNRGSDSDIYARRVDASGAVQWTSDGVSLCSDPDNQYGCLIAQDGTGGGVVAWTDERNGGPDEADVYAQRVNALGAVQWTPNGVPVCTEASAQLGSGIVADAAGGVVVTWEDWRNNTDSDIYAQRVDASGATRWTVNGVALCTATGEQAVSIIASDGVGGGIVAWDDGRSGTELDVYAQRITHLGNIGSDPLPVSTVAVVVIIFGAGSLGLRRLRTKR